MLNAGLDADHPYPQELSSPSTYLSAISYVNLSADWLHQPSGRAVIVGDDVFYSPNSSSMPALPPPADRSIIRDPASNSVIEFHSPHWWTPSAAYLPFLPTRPNFYCPPFHVLYTDPTIRKRNRVQMNSGDVLDWANLEQRLKLVIQQFQSGYAIPDSQMLPIITTSLACQGVVQYPSQFAAAEKRSRNWFSIWMAMVSFCIAVAQATDGEDGSVICPAWFRCLTRHVDEGTASGLHQQLSQFSGAYPRAGVFLNLLESDHVHRPSVEFYVKYGIPVWYHWGYREEALARANPAGFGRYIPPAHLLQTARSSMIKEPAPMTNERPWEAFFEDRKRRMADAGPMPRRNSTLKVLRWEKDSEGRWARILVRSREKHEALQEHGTLQKVFDENTNEWDCFDVIGIVEPNHMQVNDANSSLISSTNCDPRASFSFPVPLDNSVHLFDTSSEPLPVPDPPLLLSQPDQRSLLSVSSALAKFPPHQSPPTALTASSMQRSNLSSSPMQIYEDEYTFTNSSSPVDILRLFYGFVPPSLSGGQLFSPTHKYDESDAQNLARGVGELSIATSLIKSSLGQAAMSFFCSISQKDYVPPRSETYDLAHNNVYSIRKSFRLSYLRKLPGDIFIFVFKDHATVPWSIGVTNPIDAMFILRLDSQLNDYQIANKLLVHGVHFLTLLHLPAFATNPIPKSIPRIRLSGYKFSGNDYSTYREEREEMLRNPRISRGALKQGGILWRLAIGIASFHDVLSGPTVAVTLRGQCMSLNPSNNLMWCDDSLDQTEMDMLCGVYLVFTGMFSSASSPPIN